MINYTNFRNKWSEKFFIFLEIKAELKFQPDWANPTVPLKTIINVTLWKNYSFWSLLCLGIVICLCKNWADLVPLLLPKTNYTHYRNSCYESSSCKCTLVAVCGWFRTDKYHVQNLLTGFDISIMKNQLMDMITLKHEQYTLMIQLKHFSPWKSITCLRLREQN
jgi:hypothetical protein